MPKFDTQTIQAIRDAVDIIDIAGEMTRLTKKGRRHEGLCPFHKEKTPSFSVDPDQGVYYCFGCGAGGDSIGLYMQYHGDDFGSAMEALAQRYGIALPDSASMDERRGPDPKEVLEAAASFFRSRLRSSDFALRYLEKRRMPQELIERYGLGYAPDGWQNLLEAFQGRFPVEQLVDTGLVGRSDKGGRLYDRFRHRLMFPIHSASGRLLGFGGRTLGDDKAKYVNTSETAQFHKGRLLYGLNQAKRPLRDGGKALLVEGYFDVMGAAACGIDWAVAGMGTSLTPEQAALLARYTDSVVVAYDGDAAGEKAFQRAVPILLAAGLGVRRAAFPAGHDPDSLRLEAGPEAVAELVENAVDGVRLEIGRLTPPEVLRDPQRKTRSASEIAELLRPIRDEIVRRSYGQYAAERLGIAEEVLWRRVAQGGESRTAPAAVDLLPPELRPQTSSLSEVRSMEESALAFFLQADPSIPAPEELPPKEIFRNVDCRNIYAVFCALYRGNGKSPSPNEVISRLDREGSALDLTARLLLEEPNSDQGGLRANLDRLLHRWYKQRQPELMRQINDAQQHDDQARLAQLLEEKSNLSHRLHPEGTGKLW